MKIEESTDVSELGAFLQSFGEGGLPDDSVQVNILREAGEIIGCVMSEGVTHVGPFYLRREYLGGTAGALLIRHVLKTTHDEIHVLAMNEETASHCERIGMQKMEGTLYVREKR